MYVAHLIVPVPERPSASAASTCALLSSAFESPASTVVYVDSCPYYPAGTLAKPCDVSRVYDDSDVKPAIFAPAAKTFAGVSKWATSPSTICITRSQSEKYYV